MASPGERVAVVTGANKGIGYHVAQQLLASGKFAHVVLACRDAARGRKAAAEIGGEFRQLDLGNQQSIAAFAEGLRAAYGRLDCLVNNGAIAFKGADPTPFQGQTRPTLAVNFYGTVTLTEALWPLLRASADARVVNVASMAGHLSRLSPALQAKFASPSLTMSELQRLVATFERDVAAGRHQQQGWGNSNYGFSKLALIAATKVWARENPGMLINACCPGYCDTDMSSHQGPRPAAEGARNAVLLAELPKGGPSGAFFEDMRESHW